MASRCLKLQHECVFADKESCRGCMYSVNLTQDGWRDLFATMRLGTTRRITIASYSQTNWQQADHHAFLETSCLIVDWFGRNHLREESMKQDVTKIKK